MHHLLHHFYSRAAHKGWCHFNSHMAIITQLHFGNNTHINHAQCWYLRVFYLFQFLPDFFFGKHAFLLICVDVYHCACGSVLNTSPISSTNGFRCSVWYFFLPPNTGFHVSFSGMVNPAFSIYGVMDSSHFA